MRNYVLLLAGVCLLHTSIASAATASQAAGAAKPAPQTATPPADAAKPKERKEIKVPEKVLMTYAGEYELEPGRTLTIELKDGSLWGAPTGQNLRQLFAESQTKFYLKDLPVELTFKVEKGKVTGLLYKQGERPERDMTKIK